MSNQATIRIIRELSNIQQSNDLSITAACQDDDDVRRLTGLIVGPPDTPYEFGFFEFSITFPNNYPTEPPTVTCLTTNNGCTRFNPNIYASGKVCLSILGTWSGSSGEQWSSAQGLESILLSVQSLMSANPYSNEPGFERQSERDKKIAQDYIEKIRHETLRISVIQRLERALGIVAPDPALKRKHSALNDGGPAKADANANANATANGLSSSSSSSASTGQDSSKKKEKYPYTTEDFLLALLMPTPPPSTASGSGASSASTAPGSTATTSSGIAAINNTHDLPCTTTTNNIQNTPFFARRADPFNDLLKRRFLWYYDTYHAAIQRGMEKYPKHTPFSRMPFELGSNSMDGVFQYRELLPRLVAIRQAITEETLAWGLSAYDALLKEGRVYNTLKRQCEQVMETLKERSDFTVDIALDRKSNGNGGDANSVAGQEKNKGEEGEENPFVWNITYFGKPMTHLDGGIFNIKCHLSPRFPFERPRVFVNSPNLFHLRVAPASGLLCYETNIKKGEDMMEHIEGLIRALEGDEAEPYDPRMKVNKEAWEMVWGKEEEEKEEKKGKGRGKGIGKKKDEEETGAKRDVGDGWKMYHRRLRRSVQDGLEGEN